MLNAARYLSLPLCLLIALLVGTANAQGVAQPPNGYTRVLNAGIPGHNTDIQRGISVAECAAQCNQEDWCKSFDYDRAKRICYLQDVNAADVGGLKRNYAGNPYDHYQRQYPSSPPAPSGTEPAGFIHVPNAGIPGHNTRVEHRKSVTECAVMCRGENWCKSFDYDRAKRICYLQDVNAADVGGLKRDYKGNPYDHYQRQ